VQPPEEVVKTVQIFRGAKKDKRTIRKTIKAVWTSRDPVIDMWQSTQRFLRETFGVIQPCLFVRTLIDSLK